MSTSAGIGIKEHPPYTTYPEKVYDYANGWFKLFEGPRLGPVADSLADLRKKIRYFKGYLVPIGTLYYWHSNFMKYGNVRGVLKIKEAIINELQQNAQVRA